jgi:hypothetical protein
MLPELNSDGELPVGVHLATWSELREFCGSSLKRTWLAELLQALLSTSPPMNRIAAAVETGDYDDATLIDEEYQSVREPANAGPPSAILQFGELQRSRGDLFHSVHYGLDEAQCEFRANALVPGKRLFEFRIGLRQPNDGQRQCFFSSPDLTCSQETTS